MNASPSTLWPLALAVQMASIEKTREEYPCNVFHSLCHFFDATGNEDNVSVYSRSRARPSWERRCAITGASTSDVFDFMQQMSRNILARSCQPRSSKLSGDACCKLRITGQMDFSEKPRKTSKLAYSAATHSVHSPGWRRAWASFQRSDQNPLLLPHKPLNCENTDSPPNASSDSRQVCATSIGSTGVAMIVKHSKPKRDWT